MSPKSRGRPPGRGRPRNRRPRPAVRDLSPARRVLSAARPLVDSDDRLDAEVLASGWLGEAWATAGIGEREPEARLVQDVVARAVASPTPAALAAVAALRLVAPPSEHELLDETVRRLRATVGSAPAWATESMPPPVRAWRGVDPWDSRRVLLVKFGGPEPHTLFAEVLMADGRYVLGLGVLPPDAAEHWAPSHPPLPLVEVPVDEALGELAACVDQTDRAWPRQDEESYVDLRRLAAARCATVTAREAEWQQISDEERARLIDDFVATSGLPDDSVTRSLADLLVDFGDGYLASGVLAWSPLTVELFLADWVPRKVALDAEQRAALPDLLRAWVRFALVRRAVAEEWITPVVAAVSEHEETFQDRFDDEQAWGPAKTVATALQERGIDLTDQAAVEAGIRAYNAEQLARRLLPEPED